MLATEVRTGDAPKPPFSIKTDEKSKESGHQPPVNHRNFSLFLSLEDLIGQIQMERMRAHNQFAFLSFMISS